MTDWKQSACILCECNCGIEVQLDDTQQHIVRTRGDGSFEAIDWDTAIREVSQRLMSVRDTFGGESIFYYGARGSRRR